MMQTKQFIILMCAGIFISACGDKNAGVQPTAKNISESVYASGIIKSKDQYEVFSKVNGILQKVLVKEGDSVKKGQPLFQLNQDNAHLNTDNARLVASKEDYTANYSKLGDANNKILLARNKLANESLLWKRQKNLWENKIGTKAELEQKALNVENAKTVLASEIVKYEDLQRQLMLASEQSKNNLRINKTLENDLVIKSEIDGTVFSIFKEQSELISNLTPIAVIGNQTQFLIEMNIDEHDIIKIKIGQQVIIRMDSYKDKIFEGKISSIDPMMDESTRTFKAKAIFIEQPAILYPNLTIEANIIIQSKQNALTIPRIYLLNDSTVTLKNGKLQKVKIGLMDYTLVEIKGGIDKNTEIILPKK